MARQLHAKPQNWRDIVGMPDSWDKKNITTIINNFKKQKFSIEGMVITGKTFIEMEVADAKRMHQVRVMNEFNMKIKDGEHRAVTAIPKPLHETISQAYPTMFKDKDHFTWFVNNFKEFMIADRF